MVTVIDSLKGQDYINLWADKNAEEVVAREEAQEQSQSGSSRASQ